LREEGLGLVQKWAGRVWTDYGEHDPGVTILEVLCYGLTELGYRAGLPVEDLLASPPGAAGGAEVLVRPSRLYACEPVTPNDFRKLLIDRVPRLGDAWIEVAEPGLYHLRLYRAPRLPGLPKPHREDERLVRRARRAFHRHRPLGEDLASVTQLRPVPVTVGATVTIMPSPDPERVMAELLYRIGRFVAPEPRRRSVSEFPGAAAASLSEGPALANGLIPYGELQERRRTIAAADVERHVSAHPEVLSVSDLSLSPAPRPLADDECFALDAGVEDGRFAITLVAAGVELKLDPGQVRRRLEGLWADHRRTWRTVAELARAFPMPVGRPRDTASHRPLASHFPAVYGLDQRQILSNAPPARRAQAKQLLGYLSLFDRTMVDYLDRLSHFPRLLGAAGPDEATFQRSLAEANPGAAPLLIGGGPDADSLLGRSAVPLGQQERLLDFVLALYGESPEPLMPGRAGRPGDPLDIYPKRDWLGAVARLGARRGRGFDFLDRRSRRLSGLEQRARILLGSGEEVRRRRPRLRILEHVLLRSRGTAEAAPFPVEPLAVSAVVHAGEPDRTDAGWRRQLVRMIRAETPSHLAVHVHLVNRSDWVRFKRLHRLWR
ncbi:MAG TPA: hypothetical protein VF606_09890, partial [Geminicoccaceae bacterium]